MKIASNTVATLILKIKDRTEQILNDGKTPFAYLQGSGGIFPVIEQSLEGQETGFHLHIDLPAKDAFGEIDERLKEVIDKKNFPAGIKVRGTLERYDDHAGAMREYIVTKIKGSQVFLDANHPLAGRSLSIDLKVIDVRMATAEELAHGHAHGEHGHHH